MFLFALLFSLVFPLRFLVADYGWAPEEQSLQIKVGWEFFQSENNFLLDGEKVGLSSNGIPSTLTENRFALDLEYGLSDIWSAVFRSGILNAALDSGTGGSGASATGVFDTFTGFKWQAKKRAPLIAVEGGFVFPPYSASNLEANEISVGDGVYGLLTKLHIGSKLKRFVFSVSPGLYLRFGGFSHQLLLEGAISRVFRKFFLRAFINSGFSINKSVAPSFSSENLEIGSGGSFSRLSPSPDLLCLGLRAGWFLSRNLRLESYMSQSVSGRSSGDGYWVGLQLVSLLDFHVPDERETISEVPLNFD